MERLKRYLLEAGRTQTEFAKKLGVAQSTVSEWLSGESYPTVETLLEIADETALSVDELLDRKPPPRPPARPRQSKTH